MLIIESFRQNIPPAGYTHLNFAFASIDPVSLSLRALLRHDRGRNSLLTLFPCLLRKQNSYAIVPADSRDRDLYTTFTGLKQKQPGLKTYISVGG